MSAFASGNAYLEFVATVSSRRRWIMDAKGESFLSAVRATAEKRVQTINAGHGFYRAQLGCDLEQRDDGSEWEHPWPPARMIPNPKFIKSSGRANPAGFAYLYLATNHATALAETRPWLNESVTLAIFGLKKSARLVVCQAQPEDILHRYLQKEHSPTEIEQYVWNDIGHAFARPVDRDDHQSAYIPTQIIAEAFKAEGFDGLAYRSSLSQGVNVVLFDPNSAELTHRFAYTLKRVRYDFDAVPNYAISWSGGSIVNKIETDSSNSSKNRRKAKKAK